MVYFCAAKRSVSTPHTDGMQVIHAIADSPLGPFTRVGIAIPTEAHNPVLSLDTNDGTWLIWTCGCPHAWPPGDGNCTRQPLTCPGGAQAPWTTTVYSSKSLDGPWVPHVDLLGNITRGRLGSQNVSPIMHADGSLHLMFKGPDNNTEASIAYAPHWKGVSGVAVKYRHTSMRKWRCNKIGALLLLLPFLSPLKLHL